MLPIAKVIFLALVVALWTTRAGAVRGALLFFYAQLVLSLIVETICTVLKELGEQNIAVYNAYSPIEFLLFLGFAQWSIKRRWVSWCNAFVVLVYVVLFIAEYRGWAGSPLLFTRSLLLAWGYLAVLFTYLLVQLARATMRSIWKEPLFWVYLSIMLFYGASLPFVGLMNHIYLTDAEGARDLLLILDVLYFLSYAFVGIAGWMRWRKPELS